MEVSQDHRQDPYWLAAKLAEEGEEDVAYGAYSTLLNKNFDDARALYGLARLYQRAEHYGMAFNLFRLCAGFKKLGPGPWNGMGLCQAETYDVDAALNFFRKALQLDGGDVHALSNISLAYLLKCEPEKALKFASLALERNPNFESVIHHQAYANLMLGNWKEGWEGHARILGKVKTRTERFYENKGRMLPKWNGEPGKKVLVYGEQGIGDEISFASCIPDLVGVSEKVVFDCDHRLETLFKRSFPKVDVYGTRFKDPLAWIDDYDLDARVAIGDLPGFFRNEAKDFPGAAYLEATPKRLADSPVIGIAWTGGRPNTGSVIRSLTLEDFAPILKSVKANWVSLQYKDSAKEIEAFKEKHGIEIHQPKWTEDYSDTAEVVAGLDLVISVTTAVAHLAGALGKECWCIAPNRPRWFYGIEGDLPWYKSVKMFRQSPSGRWPMEGIERVLRVRYERGL